MVIFALYDLPHADAYPFGADDGARCTRPQAAGRRLPASARAKPSRWAFSDAPLRCFLSSVKGCICGANMHRS